MSLNRRGFIKTAAGALAYASSFDLLAQAKIDSSSPSRSPTCWTRPAC